MIENRSALAKSLAHETACYCIEAGIEAARPERVVHEQIEMGGNGMLELTGDENQNYSPGHNKNDNSNQNSSYYLPGYEEVVVVGAGKAAAHVAAALEAVLGDWVTGGIVVTNDPVPVDRIDVVEASHPVPDEAGLNGARRIQKRVATADGGTLVIAVCTGGGSALLPAPAGDISLQDLQSVTERLIESGATIDEINAVRKHCSDLKGGQLARVADPAPVLGLLCSDVVGDDPAVIASGPTTPDPTTFADALTVLQEYGIDTPERVRSHLERGAAGTTEGPDETPTADDPVFENERVQNYVLANGWTALEAARNAAEDAGYRTLVLSSRIEGEASEAAKTHAAIASEIHTTGHPIDPPAVVLSGGETTVTVSGDGRGGPNTEFALSAARSLPAGAILASVDTDGEDGRSKAAGALVDSETVDDDAAARNALRTNDAASYLDERDALIETGQTGTNVNDLRVLVVRQEREDNGEYTVGHSS